MRFVWNEDKNNVLRQHRNISFEQILTAIEDKKIVDVIEHPNKVKYKGQIYIMVNYDEYIYVVPAVISESEEECFLKTIYPSRKYTQKYLRGITNEENE
jgi:uncharacterized DUF497 family protein